ncbi:hypothetical protein CFIMG_003320RAa [Ceratocystis fimbriata CBS 114723]|uniref:ubiquitinyl hydrolase 1 n=1 Tax=Ceratocystis fimbriata CBS 114723 TaxID=1035309 RepID=A0A2C5X6W8_9PEZI|nr:hypothetical protein CFIMG_003320RAa [Ceratocystis fimbriata CBS 114723]
MNRMFASRTEKRDKASPENKIGDKEASPRKSSEQGNKALLKSSTMFSLFSSDKPEKSDKLDRRDVKVLEKAAEDSETSKIASIQVRLQELGLPPAPPCVIRATMKSTFANSNIDKTVRYLQVQNMAIRGDIQPYDPNVIMQGCRNRNGVTCYLDALLFAMFAKLNAFEYMLQGDIQDENKRNLAVLLRAFVTLLRSGELIQPDLVALIQDSLAKCGWEAANRCQQQDTSEAFGFISETLELPLLRLKVDLYHTGKKDDADHRFVEERLLNIAVPSLEDNKVVRLEDCLMEYFNGQVEVQRHNSDEKEESLDENEATDQTTDEPENCSDDKRILLDTLEETPTQSPTIRSPTENMSSELFALHKSISHQSRPSMSARTTGGFRSPSVDGSILGQRRLTSPIWDASSSAGDERPTRTRSMSLMQRVIVGEDGRMTPTSVSNLSPSDDLDNKKQKVANVITLPAWQVFRWIPWFSPDKYEPNSDADLIRNFNQRPVIGICLKRYQYHEDGSITKIHTEVDIPDSLRMPHIIANGGDSLDDSNCLSTEYKLVLQSVVSHKGPKFDDGHYVSLARVAPKILTENRRYDADPPPDYEEAQWVKFDDLKPIGEKVQPVDDIKSALKAETPYLLFYQIVPTMDDDCSTPTSSGQPPSYTDSRPSTSSRCEQTVDLEKSLGQLPVSPGANGMGSAIETSMNVDELVVTDTMGSDAEPIRVNIERVPTLSAEKIPNSVNIEINPANLQPVESKKPAVSYFPMFYEAEATQAQSSPQPQPSSPVPPSSPRPSSDSTRHRVSFDDNEKMPRTSGQFNDQSRLIAGSQNDGSSGGERASSSRFGFGHAVVRFSRSASRHSRSSSHSVPPGEENSNHGRFSLDSRKSISLSNITRSLVGKESRDFLRDKQCDATTSHVALPSLPVIESPTATNLNAHIDVPKPQHSEHHEEQVSSTETLAKSSGEDMENVGRVSDVSIAIGEVENMDTPMAVESELDVSSSKKRKRRGKKKASGGHEHDPERQCQVM